MRGIVPLIVLSSALMLSGCIVRTALDVVTAPVKIVSKAADVATTSQSEADEKRGRDLRKGDEALGKLDRKREKLADGCASGDRSTCRDLAEVEAEIRALNHRTSTQPGRR